MKKSDEHKLISAGATMFIMALLLVFMIFCGFSYQDPPPPPKHAVMIELEPEDFGNGHQGGGNHQQGGSEGTDNAPPQNSQQAASSRRSTTSASSKPTKTDRRSATTTTNTNNASVNQGALFGSRYSSGQGNGTGNGASSGRGNGLGLGDAGSGGNTSGVGTGTGHDPKRGPSKISLNIDETPGAKVYVQVEVNEAGEVVYSRILNDKQHQTTGSPSTQSKCLAKAKSVKFKKGIHEFRIILFTF